MICSVRYDANGALVASLVADPIPVVPVVKVDELGEVPQLDPAA